MYLNKTDPPNRKWNVQIQPCSQIYGKSKIRFFNFDKVTIKHVLDNLKNSIYIKQNIFLQILPTQFTIHTVHISEIIRLSATQNQNENIL